MGSDTALFYEFIYFSEQGIGIKRLYNAVICAGFFYFIIYLL